MNTIVMNCLHHHFQALDMSSYTSAAEHPLFVFCWRSKAVKKTRDEWTLTWPSEKDCYLRFVGQLVGHTFAHGGYTSCTQILQGLLRQQDSRATEFYVTFTAMIADVHKALFDWVFDKTLKSSCAADRLSSGFSLSDDDDFIIPSGMF